MRSGVIIGAYALAPPAQTADAEERWYTRVARIDGAVGLEVPFREGFHDQGIRRFADLVPERWRLVVTMLPLAMARLRQNPSYGLASADPGGRQDAVDDLARLLAAAQELGELRDDIVMESVQMPSAPRGGASAEAFAESLREISDWVWPQDCAMVVEHCDAAVGSQPAAKGFLPLESELSAVAAVQGSTRTAVGQAINWGRSAIEGRSAATPSAHIDRLAAVGTLRGLFLSGAADRDGPLGGAWADVHNPISTVDSTSLLTAERIREAVHAAIRGGAEYVGVKVQDPTVQDDIEARMVALERTVQEVQRARGHSASTRAGDPPG